MRTYAPAEPGAVLAGLLEEPSLARGVVHHAVLPAAGGGVRGPSRTGSIHGSWPGSATRGIEPAVHPPGRGDRGRHGRRGRRRRHADRVGQVAVLLAADPPGHRRRSGVAGAAPVPDQGARPGPGDRVRRADARRPGCRSRRRPTTATRRPRSGRPSGRRPGRGHQPGHAPLGDPAPPHEVVPAVRAAPLHRHRRAAHVPRRVRQPRRQRPAPAAPDLRPLRQPPGDRLLLGDDREPGRAGRGADRPTRRGSSTGTARRPASATSSSSTRRSSTRRAARAARRSTLAQRWALPFLRAGRQTIVFGRSRVAVEMLLTGLRESLRESYGPRTRVRGYRGGYLPTERRAIEHGLRDGEILGVVATNALELGVDIGRLDVSILAGYPGSVAGDLAAVRAGRPARQGTSVAVLVASGAPVDQYVIHHPEFLLEGTPEEARARPGQPPRPARPPARRDVRAAVRAGRGVRTGAGRRPARRSSPSRATSARPATGAGTGRARTSRRRRSRCGPPPRRTS